MHFSKSNKHSKLTFKTNYLLTNMSKYLLIEGLGFSCLGGWVGVGSGIMYTAKAQRSWSNLELGKTDHLSKNQTKYI